MMKRNIIINAKDRCRCKRFKKARLNKVICRYCGNTYYITDEEWFGVPGSGRSFTTLKREDTKICWNCFIKLLTESGMFRMYDPVLEMYRKYSLRGKRRK